MNNDYVAPTIDKIRQRRKKRIVISMYSVFGDESHDENKERVFVVGGIMGTEGEWDDIAIQWNQLTKGIPLHASDCQSGHGDYKTMPKEERDKLYVNLVTLLANTKLMGRAIAMDLKDYRDVFDDHISHIPYNHCFFELMVDFIAIAQVLIPQEKMKFTFDANPQTDASAQAMYDFLTSPPKWEGSSYLSEISFACSQHHVGLQVADLWVREVMKHADNQFVGPVKRPVRKSFRALTNTGLYKVRWFSKKYFENESEKNGELADILYEKYEQWLMNKKLPDNIVNRNRFLKYSLKDEDIDKRVSEMRDW